MQQKNQHNALTLESLKLQESIVCAISQIICEASEGNVGKSTFMLTPLSDDQDAFLCAYQRFLVPEELLKLCKERLVRKFPTKMLKYLLFQSLMKNTVQDK